MPDPERSRSAGASGSVGPAFSRLRASRSGGTALEYGMISALLGAVLIGGVSESGVGGGNIFGEVASAISPAPKGPAKSGKPNGGPGGGPGATAPPGKGG